MQYSLILILAHALAICQVATTHSHVHRYLKPTGVGDSVEWIADAWKPGYERCEQIEPEAERILDEWDDSPEGRQIKADQLALEQAWQAIQERNDARKGP